MGMYPRIIAGGLALAGLSGLIGCDSKKSNYKIEEGITMVGLEDLTENAEFWIHWFDGEEDRSFYNVKGQLWGCRVIHEQLSDRPQYLTRHGNYQLRADFKFPKDDRAGGPHVIVFISEIERKEGSLTEKYPDIRFSVWDRRMGFEDLNDCHPGWSEREDYLKAIKENVKMLKTLPDSLQERLSPIYEHFKVWF